jgi:hypothetical protein
MIARIATIHFAPVEADRSPVGLGIFKLPAVAADAEPFIFEIPDMLQRERGNYPEGRQTKTRPLVTYNVRAMDIARDIVNQWTANGSLMDVSGHPGIWVVRDYMPILTPPVKNMEGHIVDHGGAAQLDAEGHAQWRDATPEEKKAMWEEDLAHAKTADYGYARRLFDFWATRILEKPAMRASLLQISPNPCLLGAKRYGFTADWLSETTSVSSTRCPYCQKAVLAGTVRCPNCQEVVDFEKYAELESRKAAALAAAGVSKPASPMPGRPAAQARA